MGSIQIKPSYQRLTAEDEEYQNSPVVEKRSLLYLYQSLKRLGAIDCLFLIVASSFLTERISHPSINNCGEDEVNEITAPRIPVSRIQGEFVFSSPFSREPPQGEGAGEESELIWDALVPNGLGYFRDGDLAPMISIPTVFHQLHCLYIVRRAYYSKSSELQEFDFGKNRSIHAAHCFDYLAQSITCAADSTIEPAENDMNGFLGSGFPRQCRDFEVVKNYVERWRVFNATGFLAHGLAHGQAHVITYMLNETTRQLILCHLIISFQLT
ncbi:hypothetical protein F5Y04DRAFT_285635 [Hypomontagnella monticulosa]|nr:hypothetical protein F5Y04DRAFT_285635 [Hypomontagnella monticulosa]